jgi:hypothetical protein
LCPAARWQGDTWRTYLNAWDALLRLRTTIRVERGLSILSTIVSDQRVNEGLGAAVQMYGIAGEPPDEIIIMLEKGPVEHLHRNAFKYRQLLSRELFGIRRVKEVKLAALGLCSSSIVAALFGFFDNFFSYLLDFDDWFG